MDINRYELLEQLSEVSSALKSEALVESFASKFPPAIYSAPEMLTKQCGLVGAPEHVLRMARVTEWQARNQRSQWATDAPSKLNKVSEFDERLIFEWEYNHSPICQSDQLGDEELMASNGLALLNWSIEKAPIEIGSIENAVTASFYVRGSFQILSIDGKVGWHPEYRVRLGFIE